MRVLLDTHTFIWWDIDHTKLSLRAWNVCQDKNNTLLLSIASIWEMQIKIQLGKMQFTMPLSENIHRQQSNNRLEVLAITPDHVFKLEDLPDYHRDPFDRLLIAQAMSEQIPLVSADAQIARYPIQVIWR